MPHRALQVLDASKAAIIANGHFGDRVYKQRALSLSEEEQELPAACPHLGEDTALSDLGNDNVAFIDSLQALVVRHYAKAATEDELTDLLLEQRRQIHRALMADQTLGLSFVIGIRYGGAGEPEINTEGGRLVGSLESRWAVHYRMNITDPN